MFTTNVPMFYHKNRTPINMTHFTSEKKHTKTTKGINLQENQLPTCILLQGICHGYDQRVVKLVSIYLCKQSLSLLKVRVQFPPMVRCGRYNFIC